jgi:VWFA-related protein
MKPEPSPALWAVLFAALSAPVILAGASQSSSGQSKPPLTLRAETRVVQIEVSVRDAKGRAVADLSKEDFTVTDEGKPRGIDIFSADGIEGRIPPTPVSAPNAARAGPGLAPAVFSNRGTAPPPAGHSTVIVVDYANADWMGGRAGLDWASRNVLDLAKKARPDERIALYVIGRMDGLVLLQDYTADRDLLLKSIKGYFPRYLAMYPGVNAGLYMYYPKEAPKAGSPTRPEEVPYENTAEDVRKTMQSLADHLALTPGRKSVFWVSPGFGPRLLTGPKWDESPAWKKTITALNEADVAVNAVDTVDAPALLRKRSPSRIIMEQIAGETGGRVWSIRNDEALAEGIDDARATYTLGFYLAEGERDDRFHGLQVRVNRPGLELAYRQGYYAGDAETPPPDPKHNWETLEAALLNQADAHDVGITAHVDVAPGRPRGVLSIRMNLDPRTVSLKEHNEGAAVKLDELLVEVNSQGNTMAKVSDTKTFRITSENRARYESEGVSWPQSMPLVQGTTKLTIVVRDTESGRVGSLSVPVD